MAPSRGTEVGTGWNDARSNCMSVNWQDGSCEVGARHCTAAGHQEGCCQSARRPSALSTCPSSSSSSMNSMSSGVCGAQGSLVLEHVIHHLNEGILVADPHQPGMPFVYVSDAFLQLTGYSSGEVLGASWSLLLGPGTHPAVFQQFQTALASHQDVSVEIRTQKADSSSFWSLLSLTHIRDSVSGELLHVVGVQRDISDIKHWQQAERQLHQERCAAAAAQEARNRFLATMSHELRTPLNGILASAQLLIASQLSPEQRELAETVFDSSNALLGTLADILDFSVLNEGPEGALPLRKEPVCLQHALEGVAEMVSPTAAAKGLELCVLLDQELWGRHFMGDATRVRQVIHQLVSNAVKFTERGQVLVHAQLVTARPGSTSSSSSSMAGLPLLLSPAAAAGAEPVSAAAAAATQLPLAAHSGDTAPEQPVPPEQQQQQQQPSAAAEEVEVSAALQQPAHEAQPLSQPLPPGLYIHIHDSGIGISPSQLPHLFDCFKQAHGDTMSRKYGGTGLGLALSKRLAQAMHGDIYVCSVPQQGSKFTFALHPMWCAPQAQAQAQQQQQQPQQQSVRTGGAAAAATAAAGGPAAAPDAEEACGESDTPTAASTDLRLTKPLCRYASTTSDGLSGAAGACAGGGEGGGGSAGSSRGSPGREPLEGPLTPPIAGQAGAPGVSCSSFCLEGYAPSCGSSWYDSEGDAGRCYQCYPPHKEEVEGRRVLVDVRHPALAAQTGQLLQQLGLVVIQADGLCRRSSCGAAAAGFLGGVEEEGEGQGVSALGAAPADAPLGLLFNKAWSGDTAISRWLQKPGPLPTPALHSSSCSIHNSVSKPYQSSLYDLGSSSSSSSSSSGGSGAHSSCSKGTGAARLAAVPPSTTTQAPSSRSSAAAVADVAIVSSCRLAAALRTGWKGRPLLVLGDPQEVPEKLHPLVVMVSKPLKLAKLAAALSKAAAMLSWSGGLQPRLGRLALVAPAGGLGLGASGSSSRRGYTGARSAAAAAAAGAGWPEELTDGDMYVRRASIDNSALVKRAAGRQGLPGLPPVPGAAAAGGQRGSPLAPAAAGAAGATEQQQQQQQLAQPPPPEAAAAAAPAGASAHSSSGGEGSDRSGGGTAPAGESPGDAAPGVLQLVPRSSTSSDSSSGTGDGDNTPHRRTVKQMLSSAAVVAMAAAVGLTKGGRAKGSDSASSSTSSRASRGSPVVTPVAPSATPAPLLLPPQQPMAAVSGPAAGSSCLHTTTCAPSSGAVNNSTQAAPVFSLTATSGSAAPAAAAPFLSAPQLTGSARPESAAAAVTAAAAGPGQGLPAAPATPLPAAYPAPPPPAAAAAAASAAAAAGVKAPRILIAEDNRVNQLVVLRVLQTLLRGCRPDVVENGLQVLRALERQQYDLILMDIHMPEMDGLEASQRIQQLYAPEQRPRIIALSADTLTALREQCAAAGIEEFISKPFRVEDLRRVVASLSVNKQASAQA